MMDKLKECVRYFKERPCFDRMFAALKSKYESLGHVGGKIIIENPNTEEREGLRGFLRKDFANSRSITVSVAKIEKALTETKFEGVELEQVLLEYFNRKIYPKQQLRQSAALSRREYFDCLLNKLECRFVRDWLYEVLELKTPPYSFIIQKYEKDSTALAVLISNVSKALEYLFEGEKVMRRLAVFSVKITDDPHYFDEETEADRLLTYGLCKFYKYPMPSNAEKKAELLYMSGIVRDDISNFTVCYGLGGTYNDGSPHMGLVEFAKHHQPIHISVANLLSIGKVFPIGNEKRVYVVENPSVFSAILDARKQLEGRELAMVCTSGQIKLASLIMLDRLVEGGAQLLYSGDFDPDGLAIAQRLRVRYGTSLSFWRYSKEDYLCAMSKKSISQKRLNMLDNIDQPEFLELMEEMRKLRLAGYQENILDSYISDLKGNR